MADIISTIVHCISNFLWLCSQPAYLILSIYETNNEAVSAAFLAAYHFLHYTAQAVHLLAVGLFSMVELIVEVLVSSRNAFFYTASAAFTLTKFLIQLWISVFQTLLSYGPCIISSMWYGAVWCFTSLRNCIQLVVAIITAVLPAPSVLLELLTGIVTFLCRGVVSVGTFMATVMQTLSGTLTQCVSSVVAYPSGTLTAFSNMFLRYADDLWHTKDTIGAWMMTAQDYSNRKLDEIHAEIIHTSSNAFSSFVDLIFSFFSVIFYVGVFAVVCLLMILVPMKFYSLYTSALSLANTLVGLFHRTLFPSERNSRRHREQVRHMLPRFPHDRERRLLQEGDMFDVDNDNSLLSNIRARRRAPMVPQPRAQRAPPPEPRIVPRHAPAANQMDHAPDVPGPSGEQNQRPFSTKRSPPSPQLSTSSPTARRVPQTTTASLARQLEEERELQLCVVCQDNSKNILILPCKHLCICLRCVEEITGHPRRDARKCPLCREFIKSYLEVYA